MTLDCLDLLSTASADKCLSKDINVIGVEKKTASTVEEMSLLQRIKKKEDPSKHLPAF